MPEPTAEQQGTDQDRSMIDAVRQQVEAAEERIGAKPEEIGGYRIFGVLGQGGMGVVYEAEQQHPKRTVALKVLRSGIVSIEMLRRFEKEAQVLGRLHHVGIAQIYEGGTADSGHGLQPFFAMERVDGLPLTDYCEANKLNTHARLTLLAKVCDAIEHAHQKNVVHRDLKPSNILVDRSGQPKILDFGVARVTDAGAQAATLKTDARKLIGTLPYMSPEQISGNPREVDARSDVYAIGVLGYRTLAGRYPFGISKNSIADAVRAIQDEEPARLSLQDRNLRGDVETIILKALDKDPSRRYESAADLAADIRRFLNQEPIRARPAGRVYRFVKFAGRNKALVCGILGVFLALLLGLIASGNAIRLAERRLEDLQPFADQRDLTRYLAEAELLWPAHPRQIPAMEDWLRRVEVLRERLPVARSKLAAIHERSRVFDQAREPNRAHRRHEQEFAEMTRILEKKRAALEELKEAGRKSDHPDIVVLNETIERIEQEAADLNSMIAKADFCTFARREDGLQHDALARLVKSLETFFHSEEGAVADVRRRLAFARTVQNETLGGEAIPWSQAIASISNRSVCPQYDGLVIQPQVGFVPLGRDPQSGLWEFAHLQTGKPPARNPEGTLDINSQTGLVFVLVPGGTLEMGASQDDELAHEDERPRHDVHLSPFLISKYEMTQAQWLGAESRNPSTHQPGNQEAAPRVSLEHPVENISWEECEAALWRLGLTLPTEAQWEYAVRGQSTSAWWTGNRMESVAGAGNFAGRDEATRRVSANTAEAVDTFGDTHAPVAHFKPNRFGLFDVCGNVAEWCLDAFGGYQIEARPEDGKRLAGAGRSGFRVIRGGSYLQEPSEARSSSRQGRPKHYRHHTIGVRPAARLHHSE